MTQPRITKQLAEAAQTAATLDPSEEACGIFFFPADGRQPKFLKLPNRHMEPKNNFQIDYEDMAEAITSEHVYPGTIPEGTFTIFHSHPVGTSGKPGLIDMKLTETFAKEMDAHPMWTPTFRHLVFGLEDNSWWWFDIENTGQCGWDFPDAAA